MACAPLELERSGVDLHYGMRYDEPDSGEELMRNIEANDLSKELLVEIPLTVDSLGLPVLLPENTDALEAASQHIGLNLAFIPAGDTFTISLQAPPPSAWHSRYRQVIVDLVDHMDAVPRRIILADNWEMTQDQPTEFATTLQKLKQKLPNVRMGTTILAPKPPSRILKGDFVAVEFPSFIEPKREAMALNPSLAKKIQSETGTPLYIYRSNLMGLDKLDKFKNVLRFWPEETEIEGLVLNTIYDRIPKRDSTSYFGTVRDTALNAFIEAYRIE